VSDIYVPGFDPQKCLYPNSTQWWWTVSLAPPHCPMIAKLDAWSKARRARAVGYYWVRRHPTNLAEVAYWTGVAWWRVGRTVRVHKPEDAFDTIDERRILPPAWGQ
jgi:hypothetical protein